MMFSNNLSASAYSVTLEKPDQCAWRIWLQFNMVNKEVEWLSNKQTPRLSQSGNCFRSKCEFNGGGGEQSKALLQRNGLVSRFIFHLPHYHSKSLQSRKEEDDSCALEAQPLGFG